MAPRRISVEEAPAAGRRATNNVARRHGQAQTEKNRCVYVEPTNTNHQAVALYSRSGVAAVSALQTQRLSDGIHALPSLSFRQKYA